MTITETAGRANNVTDDGVNPLDRAARPAAGLPPCPPWCPGDCLLGDITCGIAINRVHTRTLADIIAADAVLVDDQTPVRVYIERFDSLDPTVPLTETRVVVDLGAGRAMSAALTAEQLRMTATAMLTGASLLDAAGGWSRA